MANLVLTQFFTTGDFETVLTALEVEMETVDTTKTVVEIGMKPVGNNWHAWALYET